MNSVFHEIYEATRNYCDDFFSSIDARHNCGFRILYAKVWVGSETFILGLQPGGDASHHRDHEHLEAPVENEYLDAKWPLAVELRKRFGEDFLEKSVGSNVVFMRAPSWKIWEKIPENVRIQVERFCVEQNKRLIHAIKPKRILLLGWDALEIMGGQNFTEMVADAQAPHGKSRKRLLMKGMIEGIPAFAIPHPSASWKNPPVRQEQWRQIAAHVLAQD